MIVSVGNRLLGHPRYKRGRDGESLVQSINILTVFLLPVIGNCQLRYESKMLIFLGNTSVITYVYSYENTFNNRSKKKYL